MIGFILGAAVGALQFFLLYRFTSAVTTKGMSIASVTPGIIQFFLPLAILVPVAFLLRSQLIFVGAGLAAALICGAVIFFARTASRRKKEQGND